MQYCDIGGELGGCSTVTSAPEGLSSLKTAAQSSDPGAGMRNVYQIYTKHSSSGRLHNYSPSP